MEAEISIGGDDEMECLNCGHSLEEHYPMPTQQEVEEGRAWWHDGGCWVEGCRCKSFR